MGIVKIVSQSHKAFCYTTQKVEADCYRTVIPLKIGFDLYSLYLPFWLLSMLQVMF